MAFAARALPEIVFTNIVGMFTVGLAPFLAQHQRLFSTIYKGSVLLQEVQPLTTLTLDVAIVDSLAILKGASTIPPGISLIDGAVHSRLEQVMLRKADGWCIASIHNVAVNPMVVSGGAAPAPPLGCDRASSSTPTRVEPSQSIRSVDAERRLRVRAVDTGRLLHGVGLMITFSVAVTPQWRRAAP